MPIANRCVNNIVAPENHPDLVCSTPRQENSKFPFRSIQRQKRAATPLEIRPYGASGSHGTSDKSAHKTALWGVEQKGLFRLLFRPPHVIDSATPKNPNKTGKIVGQKEQSVDQLPVITLGWSRTALGLFKGALMICNLPDGHSTMTQGQTEALGGFCVPFWKGDFCNRNSRRQAGL